MINKAIIIGRLGGDPETRFTNNQTPVTNFSIATVERWNEKSSGEKKERTEWHKCVAWNKAAEQISQWCKKGTLLFIEGTLQTREWTDANQITRQTTEIRVMNFRKLADPKGEKPKQQEIEMEPHKSQYDSDEFVDDIPF